MSEKIGSWLVRLQYRVTKDVVCEGCTEEQAWSNPFEHAVEETEVEMYDWETMDVRENR